MSAYQELKDACNKVDQYLRQQSSQLFCSRAGENFEDVLSNKMRDITLLSSKLKLLRAKPLSLTPQVREEPQENVLQQYEDTVQWKLIEQMTVKSLTRAHAVKSLINTTDKNLEPSLIEHKKAIIDSLTEYHRVESELHYSETLLKEREAEHAALRVEWDTMIGIIKDAMADRNQRNEPSSRGPLYLTLKKLVDKLELMRWLVGCLVSHARSSPGPGQYDWLADPHRRFSKLALTRAHNTVEIFTQDQ